MECGAGKSRVATGPADKLAAAFRAALDQLGTPKTTAAKR
jgi:hypothetical protein